MFITDDLVQDVGASRKRSEDGIIIEEEDEYRENDTDSNYNINKS